MKSRYYYFFFYILVSRTTLAYLYFFFFNWLIHNSLNLPLLIFVLQSLKTHLIEAAQRYFSMLSLDHVEILSQSFHPRSRKLRVPNTFYKFYEQYSQKHYSFLIYITITLIIFAIRDNQILTEHKPLVFYQTLVYLMILFVFPIRRLYEY